MAQSGGGASATGIRGTITPNSSLNTVHLERDDGGGYVEIAQFSGATSYGFEDALPLDNTTRTYRFYEARSGFANSANSGTAAGKPTTLSGPA